MSVASAVVDFNEGRSGILKIMIKLGLRIGHFNKQSSLKSDSLRVQTMSSELVKNKQRLDMRSSKLFILFIYLHFYHVHVTSMS